MANNQVNPVIVVGGRHKLLLKELYSSTQQFNYQSDPTSARLEDLLLTFSYICPAVHIHSFTTFDFLWHYHILLVGSILHTTHRCIVVQTSSSLSNCKLAYQTLTNSWEKRSWWHCDLAQVTNISKIVNPNIYIYRYWQMVQIQVFQRNTATSLTGWRTNVTGRKHVILMELCRTGGQSLVVILIAKRMGRQQPNTLHQLWSMSNVEVSGRGLQVECL